IALFHRQELPAAAAQHHLRAGAERGGDHLPGDVHAALGDGLGRHGRVVLPVAVGRVRPGRCRGGVGQARGADDAGGHAGGVGQLQPGQPVLAQAVGAVVALAGGHADGAHVGLHPGGDGGHGAGRVRGLGIGVVGLAEGGVREALPAEQVLLAGAAVALAFEDARGGHRGQAHAVAEEQDHVLCPAGHGAVGGRARGAGAVPPFGGLAGGAGDLRYRHLHGGRGGRRMVGSGGGSGGGAGAEQGGAEGGGEGGRQEVSGHCRSGWMGTGPARGTAAAPTHTPRCAGGETGARHYAASAPACGRQCSGRVIASAGAPRYRAALSPFRGRASMMRLVSAWLAIPFWQRVLAGFVLGALAGWLAGPAAQAWFGPLGTVYVTLIRMIAVPLVFFAVVNAVASLHGQKSVAALGGRTFLWFAVTATLAVLVGLVVGLVLKPGYGLSGLEMAPDYSPREVPDPVHVLLDVVPANPFRALTEGKIL